ncbi:hypothetical protein G6011_06946 [Alternaria panax]|uniref:Uncharacterized protein n=1 Tax=Alternaria panax TaxID=48097 RepID=A0AAD4FA15_9PLEO|nr:hypothetical protein G6011_06946 [Alternaria panax]
MASAAVNGDRAPDLTEAIVTLQQTVRMFIKDAKLGREGFVLKSVAPANDEADTAYVSITSADKETETQLEALEAQLRTLEQQLRSRGDWQPPEELPNSSIPTILDLADLNNAVTLLDHLIESTRATQQDTPQQTLSAYSWTWDPAWHEFYTYVPSQDVWVYLSRWRLNEIRNVWEHVSMSGTNLMPNTAAEILGAWEDWAWDSKWRQWYLGVEEIDTGEKSQIFASPWRIHDGGEWVYVGRIGAEV